MQLMQNFRRGIKNAKDCFAFLNETRFFEFSRLFFRIFKNLQKYVWAIRCCMCVKMYVKLV